MNTGTGKVIPGHHHDSTDTITQVIMIHIEAVPDHGIGIITNTTGVAHDAHLPHSGVIAINHAMTQPHRPNNRSSTHRSSL